MSFAWEYLAHTRDDAECFSDGWHCNDCRILGDRWRGCVTYIQTGRSHYIISIFIATLLDHQTSSISIIAQSVSQVARRSTTRSAWCLNASAPRTCDHFSAAGRTESVLAASSSSATTVLAQFYRPVAGT